MPSVFWMHVFLFAWSTLIILFGENGIAWPLLGCGSIETAGRPLPGMDSSPLLCPLVGASWWLKGGSGWRGGGGLRGALSPLRGRVVWWRLGAMSCAMCVGGVPGLLPKASIHRLVLWLVVNSGCDPGVAVGEVLGA